MKYSMSILLLMIEPMVGNHIRRNMENSYLSCPFGHFKTLSNNNMACKSCINATPTHNIAFWTNIIMIVLIADVLCVQHYTHARYTKKFMYYSFFVMTVLSMISYNIMSCNYPTSMLMIKNYMVLSWMLFMTYVMTCVNIMYNEMYT